MCYDIVSISVALRKRESEQDREIERESEKESIMPVKYYDSYIDSCAYFVTKIKDKRR